jgi:transposase-like protein
VLLAPATGPRGGVKDSPRLAETVPRRQRPGWQRGRMDATASKLQGPWYALDRAVDQAGQTRDCLRTTPRAERAAKRFLPKALQRQGVPEPLPMDGRAANQAALARYPADHGTPSMSRQGTYRHTSLDIS